MKHANIKECPFCGGKSRAVQTKDFSGYWYCECEKCYARQLAYTKDIEGAIKLWNNRYDPPIEMPAPEKRDQPYIDNSTIN